MEVNKTGA